MIDGLHCSASPVRATLILVPSVSSIHISPPPAPQQKLRLLRRSISSGLVPETILIRLRGSSYIPLYLPK